eukprot:gene3092-3558_t
MAVRKKDGGTNWKYFENQDTIDLFEPVRQYLLKNYKKYVQADPPTNKTLSNLTGQLIQFQEEAFGKNVSKPALTRLPMKQLLDLTAGGALCQILATCFKFKVDQGWRRFDFQSPSRMDRNVELFLTIEKTLRENKLLERPRVYLMPDIETKLSSKLREIIKRHQGTLMDTKDKATHIVHTSPSPCTEDDWLRPISRKDKQVLVHWWYYPDSYDSWLPMSEVSQEPESAPERQKAWEVNARWLLDLEVFNEWMNEEDYEIENTETSSDDRRRELGERSARKRKPSPSPSPEPAKRKKKGSKKQVDEKSEKDEEIDDATSELPDPDVIPNVSKEELDSNIVTNINKMNALEDISNNTPNKGRKFLKLSIVIVIKNVYGNLDRKDIKDQDQQMGSPAPSQDSTTSGKQSEAKKINETVNREPEIPHDDNLPEQTRHIIIPSYAAWFDYNSIHAIERRALPEFFNAKNKSKSSEVYFAYRNFMIDTYRLNPTEYFTATACRRNLAGDVCAIVRVHAFLEQWGLINYQVDADNRPLPMGPPPTSHFHVLCDTPSGLQPLVGLKPPMSAAQQLINLADKENTSSKANEGNNFGLRTDVYLTKKQIKGKSSAYKEWTDQETLLLLEGLELYKDDWNKVAEHVGSRTQDECILQFLRLPIEDPYLEDGGSSLGQLLNQPIPFSQAGNPVMSTVAFLASIVEPRVASAAAKAAIEEFTRLKEEIPDSLIGAHLSQGKQGVENGEADKKSDDKDIADNEKKDDEEKPAGGKLAQSTAADKATTNGVESVTKVKEEDEDEEMPEAGKQREEGDGKGEEKKAKDVLPETAIKADELLKKRSQLKEGNIKSAAGCALAAAAVKAKHLAQVEERKIKSLVALLVETQMKKLEIKLRHFEELETIMERERELLEQQRQQLLVERQQFFMEQLQNSEAKSKNLEASLSKPKAPAATLANVTVAVASSVSEPTSLQSSQKGGSASADTSTLKTSTAKDDTTSLDAAEQLPAQSAATSAAESLKTVQSSTGQTLPEPPMAAQSQSQHQQQQKGADSMMPNPVMSQMNPVMSQGNSTMVQQQQAANTMFGANSMSDQPPNLMPQEGKQAAVPSSMQQMQQFSQSAAPPTMQPAQRMPPQQPQQQRRSQPQMPPSQSFNPNSSAMVPPGAMTGNQQVNNPSVQYSYPGAFQGQQLGSMMSQGMQPPAYANNPMMQQGMNMMQQGGPPPPMNMGAPPGQFQQGQFGSSFPHM